MTEHHYNFKTFQRYIARMCDYVNVAREENRGDVLERSLASCQADLRSVRNDRRLSDAPDLKKLIECKLNAVELALKQKVRPLIFQSSEH